MPSSRQVPGGKDTGRKRKQPRNALIGSHSSYLDHNP